MAMRLYGVYFCVTQGVQAASAMKENMPLTRKIGLTLLVLLLAALLTGCWLRLAFGNVIFVEDIAQEVNEIITTAFSDSSPASLHRLAIPAVGR